ncbi:crotonase/enoyl-CoA hydratase family protein [Piscinibacter sakaiensis]|uniref:Enoyl-CoA hydratase n=1 Tax=Piscinibacter sakaiensis TaxID=1547922 RepID=A0A0K8P2C2_PISS1|nr:crotonase/enoyl-CoA hydratase family protein [Piscinibacter sakaiensis]GAP36776.1 enoyl-CoA hydratase [Piscinibacter sakaiensis]
MSPHDPADERVRCTIDAQGVAEVVLARPAKMNALDPAMFAAIHATIARLGATPGLRAVVLHGEGRAFCAGLDMASFARMTEPGGLPPAEAGVPPPSDLLQRTHGLANAYQQVAWGWRELAVPVVAAVHGVAFGGGLQIALGADLRLTTADTRFSVMEIQWGLVPDMAGCALLAGLVRTDRLRELVYTGRVLEGAEAVEFGLATRLCADPLADARALAQRIAAQSPDAVRAGKRLMGLLPAAAPADILLAEAREQQALIGSPNQAEAVRAGLARRPPVFRD